MTQLAGRKAQVKVSGGAVAFAGEATTTKVANTVYQITNAAKQVWDPSAAITVKANGVVADPSTYDVNRLIGQITFHADQGAAVITLDGSYLPLSLAAEAKQYSFTLSTAMLEDNQFGDDDVTRVAGLTDVQGSIGRWYSIDTYFEDALVAGLPVVLEFWTDSGSTFDRRIWGIVNSDGMTAAIAGLIEENVSFMGSADADHRVASKVTG